MLHEGLGSAGLWGDFPRQACRPRPALGVFAYSRAGYGASTPVKLPRPLDYMHVEALECCRSCSTRSAFARGMLLGHSDGASIAAIYAGAHQDHRVRGRRADRAAFHRRGYFGGVDRRRSSRPMRPPISRQNWRAGTAMSTTRFTAGTAPGSTRNSATGISRNTSPISACRSRSCRARTTNMGRCARSRSPEQECYCPVDVAVIPGAGHSPHREAPEATLDAIAEFASAFCAMKARKAGRVNAFAGAMPDEPGAARRIGAAGRGPRRTGSLWPWSARYETKFHILTVWAGPDSKHALLCISD